MAATIKTKIRTTTGGTASTTAGELCVNTFDKKIFIGDGAATVELANQIGYNTITTLGTISTGTWSATAIGATKGGTGQTTYAAGDLIYSSATDTLSKLTKPAATSVLSMTSGGVPSWNGITGTGSTVFGTSPSISTLEISTTTAGNYKYADINMATGVTATRTVSSTITLNAYNSDWLNLGGPVPYTKIGYISTTSAYDIRLKGGGDSYISIDNNTIQLGDVDLANDGAILTLDATVGTIDITAPAALNISSTSFWFGTVSYGSIFTATGSDIVIGDPDTNWNNTKIAIDLNAESILITSGSGGSQITVGSSAIIINTTTPVAGKVLTCMDGSGTVSWETPSGGSGTPDYVLFNLGII